MKVSELKNTNIKIKNSVDGLHSKMKQGGERFSKLEARTIEMMLSEQQRENRQKRNGQRLKDLNICVTGDPEEEKKDSRAEKGLEEMTSESFPNLVTDINPQRQGEIFKQGKSKEIHAKLHHSRTFENSRKNKIESSERETAPYLQGKKQLK